jgi:hypothetical protein
MTVVAGPSMLRSTTGLSTTTRLVKVPRKPDLPLPPTFTKVEEIARKELRRLTAKEETLELTSYQLHRLLGTTQPAWYYAVIFRLITDATADPSDPMTFLVTLDGKPALVIW